ncbi:hypothetical protein K525DRAFT_214917 [Schizophyllum commune Loenen D]|nr:hypothetical protein K525DRAFT_214917 [Schizophyllum commune Loenen D]
MSASEHIELDAMHDDNTYPHDDDDADVRTPLSQHLSPRPPHRSHSSSPSHPNHGYPDPLSPNPSARPKGSDVHPEWRRHIYLLLEVPTSSPAAFLMHVFITALIAVSAVVTVLETVPEFHSISPAVWFGVESALVALFTIEYVARCVAHSTGWRTAVRWLVSFFGIIDALAVIPYYIEIALHQDTSILFRFSILRMFRLLRVFKPFRCVTSPIHRVSLPSPPSPPTIPFPSALPPSPSLTSPALPPRPLVVNTSPNHLPPSPPK